MHDLKATLQMVSHNTFLQGRCVIRISIKSYHSAGLSHEPCHPESERSGMGANVIYNGSGPNHGANHTLHLGFMFSAPVECFIRKEKPHPHSPRQPSLRAYPNLLVWQRKVFEQRLESLKGSQ
jgi:hypothetical protein